MKTIAVASMNPVKISATLNGFRSIFPEEMFTTRGIRAVSGVSAQPLSSAETLRGALNRVNAIYQAAPEADFWVGIEGGIETWQDEMAAFAWIVIRSREQEGKSRTGSFFLPAAIVDLVRQGKELGEADDLLFQRSNSKQENGAIGILTGDAVDRTRLYEQAVILALVPFKNPELYPAIKN